MCNTTHSSRAKLLWQDAEYRERQRNARITNGGPWNKIPISTLTEKNCEYCNSPFKCLPCKVLCQRFCSKRCRVEGRRNIPNVKNRGRIPSKHVGSGVSGEYNGQLFRSLHELSFIKNVLEPQNIDAKYEALRIPLDDGHIYIPDFVSHTTKTIYEIKYEKALTQPKNVAKLIAGKNAALAMGYAFLTYTEKQMQILSIDDVYRLINDGTVKIHSKKNGGITYRKLWNAQLEHDKCVAR